MASLTELAQKAAAREIKAAEDAKKKSQRERAAGLAKRKALAAIKLKQRDLLGETIRDADLTPQEHVVIAKILGRRAAPLPKDWDVLGDWLHAPAKAKSEPANNSVREDAAEQAA